MDAAICVNMLSWIQSAGVDFDGNVCGNDFNGRRKHQRSYSSEQGGVAVLVTVMQL